MPVPNADAKHSDNLVVRIVAHNTSPNQPDTISAQKVKLHAHHGSVDVDDVEDLLEDAVGAGELEKAPDADRYRVAND